MIRRTILLGATLVSLLCTPFAHAQTTEVGGVKYEPSAQLGNAKLLLNGAGVGVLPEHALREHLHAGRLVRLCPGWIWKRVTLYALMPSRAAPGSALKAFLAMLLAEVERDSTRWTMPPHESS